MYINPLVTSLSYRNRLSATATVGSVKSYKLEPIRLSMHLDKLVDVPVCHPLRHHRELGITHRDSQQRQYIWMSKGIPRHYLLAEPLHGSASAGQLTLPETLGTDSCDFIEITCRVNPQHLNCNLAILVFTLPHVGVPAAISRGIGSIVAEWDLQRLREQSLAAAYPA